MKFKIIIMGIALGLLYPSAVALADLIDVAGIVTYGPPSTCEYANGDFISVHDGLEGEIIAGDDPSGAYPHRYHFFFDGDAGYYWMRWYTESIDQTCWYYRYLNLGNNTINGDMCAACVINR